MKIGLYPGSFDPITLGHLDVIKKGAQLFDKLYVCLLRNSKKNSYFTLEERYEMAKLACKDIENVEVIMDNGLTIDACRKNNATYILRGLRNTTDFEYELEVNNVNVALNPDISTIYVMPNLNDSFISSSAVREMLYYNSKDYKRLVPLSVYEFIEKREVK